jgi:hypothetical protein
MKLATLPEPPTTFDKIDAALAGGQVSAETAITYKTFAVFGDNRLPAEYGSSVVGGEAGLFMQRVVEVYPTLSDDTQAVLRPFFTPPFEAGSWWSLAGSGPHFTTAPSDWEYVTAAGGKARVWYLKANLENKRQAGVIAAAVTNDIWTQETGLMGREPVPDEAGVQNFVVYHQYRSGWKGAFVPYDGSSGVTVPLNCSQTPSIIYLNPNYPDRSPGPGRAGLEEITAHEFMHALQFAFPMLNDRCSEYDWLAEASATWAEDYVYEDRNTEWEYAQRYLDTTGEIINRRAGNRDYGAYLLPFFFTRSYGYPEAMRSVWENAGSMDSLQAFRPAGNFNYEQVEALWNQEPFSTFFLDEEGITYQAKAEASGILAPVGGFNQFSFKDDLYPGAIRFFHYDVDPSVRTLIFMDGLTTKISRVPEGENYVYQQDDVSDADRLGAETILLVKAEGQDEPWRLINPTFYAFCQDWSQQLISEVLVIQANQDMTQRTRMLKATGEDSRILVTSVPCVKVRGTATRTIEANGVTTQMESSNLTFELAGFDPSYYPLTQIISNNNIYLAVKSGDVSWSISGADQNGCTYSGSESFSITPDNNGSYVTLYHGYLPGSKEHLGYYGTASPDSGAEAHYTVSCPDHAPQNFTETGLVFFLPDGETPVTAAGALQGQKVFDLGGGIIETFEWNLQPIRE